MPAAARDAGLRSHAAGEVDGTWHIIEVWDSRDGLDTFMRTRSTRRSTMSAAAPAPEVVFEVHNTRDLLTCSTPSADARLEPEVKVYALSGAR